MDFLKRTSIFTHLKKYDTFAKENDFIEITLWSNDEGFDVKISSYDNKSFELTWGEFEALKKIIKKIKKNEHSN